MHTNNCMNFISQEPVPHSDSESCVSNNTNSVGISCVLLSLWLYKLDRKKWRWYVEIKCQLDATEVFIADLIACSTCFGHHYAHHQELKSIIQWLLPVLFSAVVFKLLVWCGAEGYVSGLQDAANLFRAPLCPSSGAQEYYTMIAACGISCCGFQVAGLVWSWGLRVRFAGCCQHVSGTTMPIIRSSRVLYSGCCLWYFVSWF